MVKFLTSVIVGFLCISVGAPGDLNYLRGKIAVKNRQFNHLRVKFALTGGFLEVPLNVGEITSGKYEKYVKVVHDNDLNVDVYSYPGDPRVCILFDTYGNIAGLRVGFIKEDVAKRAQSNNLTFPYYFYNKPMFTSATYWDIDLWYTSVLFLSPEKLRRGGRKYTRGVVAENVYLKLGYNWTLLPKDECQAEAKGFNKQACFTGMGMHYFYKLSPATVCGKMQGAFLLYESGQLMGLGVISFGTFTTKERPWLEDPPVSIAKAIAPNRPDCLTTWISNYGATSFHIYFKKSPAETYCTSPFQRNDTCPLPVRPPKKCTHTHFG